MFVQVQAVLTHGTAEMKADVAKAVKSHVFRLACNRYGSVCVHSTHTLHPLYIEFVSE